MPDAPLEDKQQFFPASLGKNSVPGDPVTELFVRLTQQEGGIPEHPLQPVVNLHSISLQWLLLPFTAPGVLIQRCSQYFTDCFHQVSGAAASGPLLAQAAGMMTSQPLC